MSGPAGLELGVGPLMWRRVGVGYVCYSAANPGYTQHVIELRPCLITHQTSHYLSVASAVFYKPVLRDVGGHTGVI